ncbi:hypothetical protein Krac_9516 [Ktedonobacter racemifer DSM 44963]|uniref:Uncharacterized protein n=1 Tax=Ktedonobacter racemifer DSM 44963 TaxID=485913 RepID=D6TC83_KTERA|nr:hypothetical protein Krac_9516 [Ktedonobacter racemifer DSM 44963]
MCPSPNDRKIFTRQVALLSVSIRAMLLARCFSRFTVEMKTGSPVPFQIGLRRTIRKPMRRNKR